MKVWVILGHTESGDNIGPYVLDYEPTDIEMHEIVKTDMPSEYEDCDSNYDDSYAYPYVVSETVISKG